MRAVPNSGIHMGGNEACMRQSRPLAIVTGAGRGIGAAIAIELGGRGLDLDSTDIGFDVVEPVLGEIEKLGATASLQRSDLGDVADHAELVAPVVAARGPVTCLVNNAA